MKELLNFLTKHIDNKKTIETATPLIKAKDSQPRLNKLSELIRKHKTKSGAC